MQFHRLQNIRNCHFGSYQQLKHNRKVNIQSENRFHKQTKENCTGKILKFQSTCQTH